MARRGRPTVEVVLSEDERETLERLGVSHPTVSKWRRRFVERRLEGLSDEPRPGVPRSITDDQVEAVIVRTLEETPTNATH